MAELLDSACRRSMDQRRGLFRMLYLVVGTSILLLMEGKMAYSFPRVDSVAFAGSQRKKSRSLCLKHQHREKSLLHMAATLRGGEGQVQKGNEGEEDEDASESMVDDLKDEKKDSAEDVEEQADSFVEIAETREQKEAVLEHASELRQQGKAFHDDGDFLQAAQQFCKAADLLVQQQSKLLEHQENQTEAENQDEEGEDFVFLFGEEMTTCRLHESLCRLKCHQYQECVDACTAILDSNPNFAYKVAGAVRARAYHRRAKGKLGLGDADGALEDARSAAFLGDPKAVGLYGKLMRQRPSEEDPLASLAAASSPFSSLSSTSSNSLLESLLNKSNPMVGTQGSNDAFSGMSDPTSLLASSLLGQGGPSSLLSLMGQGNSGGAGGGGLAKSVLSSLTKRLEQESTQDGICNFLQSVNPLQLQSMASMAGVELSQEQADRLVSCAHGITPKTIRRTIRGTKVVAWVIKLIRKIMGVLSKYRNVLIMIFILQWTKSAIHQPTPVNKRALKAAMKAEKKAMKQNTGSPGPTPSPKQGDM